MAPFDGTSSNSEYDDFVYNDHSIGAGPTSIPDPGLNRYDYAPSDVGLPPAAFDLNSSYIHNYDTGAPIEIQSHRS